MSEELPGAFIRVRQEYPDVAAAYDALSSAAHNSGPLGEKTRLVVKLAMAIAAGLEGATHAHVRRLLEIGATPDEIRHVALLSATTLGFPATVRGMTWVNDILDED